MYACRAEFRLRELSLGSQRIVPTLHELFFIGLAMMVLACPMVSQGLYTIISDCSAQYTSFEAKSRHIYTLEELDTM